MGVVVKTQGPKTKRATRLRAAPTQPSAFFALRHTGRWNNFWIEAHIKTIGGAPGVSLRVFLSLRFLARLVATGSTKKSGRRFAACQPGRLVYGLFRFLSIAADICDCLAFATYKRRSKEAISVCSFRKWGSRRSSTSVRPPSFLSVTTHPSKSAFNPSARFQSKSALSRTRRRWSRITSTA